MSSDVLDPGAAADVITMTKSRTAALLSVIALVTGPMLAPAHSVASQPAATAAPAKAALAAPAEAATTETCSADLETAAAIGCLVNVVRRAQGLRTLSWHRGLARAASRHTADMVQRSYFDHVSPDGSTLGERIRATGALKNADDYWLAEALAWSTGPSTGPERIVAMWWASKDHRRLMLSKRARQFGIGVTDAAPQLDAATASTEMAGLTAALELGEITPKKKRARHR